MAMPELGAVMSQAADAALSSNKDVGGQMRAVLNALIEFLKNNGGAFIDTPEERHAIARQAADTFVLIFGVTGIGSLVMKQFVYTLTSWVLEMLAKNLPPPPIPELPLFGSVE